MTIVLASGFDVKRLSITTAWEGRSIAVHRPVAIDPGTGEAIYQRIDDCWKLSHVHTGCGLALCVGGMSRAVSFAAAWDEAFDQIREQGQTLPDEQLRAWRQAVEEMGVVG